MKDKNVDQNIRENIAQNDDAITYASSGVDIDAGNRLVDRIKPLVQSTHRSEVLGNIGGFGALCELPKGYTQPVLVSGTDGVGTKLRLAMEANEHQGVGIDLVAMCVNDILTLGAEPLFFLDYYASGHLDVDRAAAVIKGIAAGCEQAGCALIGGETAEMPGMYQGEDYDLAGFCVGVVEKDQIITGETIECGNHLIGLASSGVHSNGFSLVRKLLSLNPQERHSQIDGQPLISQLLTPTKIYVQSILSLLKSSMKINGMVHITGGGLVDNLPRIFPTGLGAKVDLNAWPCPALFQWLKNKSQLNPYEFYRTFNGGIGMVLVVDAENSSEIIKRLQSMGEHCWLIGEMIADPSAEVSFK